MGNFEKYVERRGTDSKKWDIKGMHEMAEYADEESIPLWVADMDFKAPEILVRNLNRRIEHGVFGYNTPSDKYYENIKFWNKVTKNFDIEREWIVTLTGVVPALNFAIRAYTEVGDGVIIQGPVYPPFRTSIINNSREVIDNALVYKNNRYEIDFKDLELKAKNPKNKLMIICSPHNPVGRVWTKNELEKIIKICLENDIVLVSDEIHSDLILFGNKFTSIGNFGEEILEKSIICTAPTKTFNIAGIQNANIIIKNESLREKFIKEVMNVGLKTIPNLFGAIAIESLYSTEGENWVKELIKYIEDNYNYTIEFIEKNIPKLSYTQLEGTYLMWLDFRKYNYSIKELKEKLEKEAKLVIDGGEIFGKEGEGFIRVNIACHRSTLKTTLKRLEKVFK